jgi:serine/threonine-protein kinase
MEPGTRLGRYEIVSFIGAGGMGEVYRARDPQLERAVAIKVLPTSLFDDSEAVLRFEREARAAASVTHPNLIGIHDVGRTGDIHYLVMDLLEGETLRQRLLTSAPGWKSAVELTIAVAEGAGAVHASGFVHRDIKPENIFLTVQGWVKLLDFGLACPVPRIDEATVDDRTITAITARGMMIGTVAYMAPEQLRREPIDRRADIIAIGCVLFELATGRGAFRRPTQADTIAAILEGALEVPADVPEELRRIIRRCVDRSREGRFQSAADLAFALRMLSTRPTAAAAAPASVVPSVAVLPFVSTGGESEFLADGIAEELIHALAGISGLRVASRTSSFSFKGRGGDVRDIGSKLGVAHVLEGSVRRSGDRLRVTAQLVNVVDGYQTWSERFDGEMKDIFAIQDEIAATVVDRLRSTLSGRGQVHSRHPGNIDAYTLYLRGVYEHNRATPEGFEKAVDWYGKAIEAAPDYALAYSRTATVLCDLSNFGLRRPSDAWPLARAAAARALEIDPNLAPAHAAAGWVHVCNDWNWMAAEQQLRRAVELDPACDIARHFFAHFWTALGRADDARVQSEAFQQIGPLDPHAAGHMIFHHLYARDLDRAISWGEFVCERHADVPWPRVYLGMAYLRAGRPKEAIAQLSIVNEATGSPWALSNLGAAYAAAGRAEDAAGVLNDLIARRAVHYVQPYDIAVVALALGRRKETLDWLEAAAEERNHWAIYLTVDPIFDSLRGEPRLEALLTRIGLPRA